MLSVATSSHAVTQINISADKIEDSTATFEKPQLNIDLKRETLTLKSKIQPAGDSEWINANLHCQIPKKLRNQSFICDQALIKAKQLNLPFSLHVTPKQQGFAAKLALKSASFSDAKGLHAAEKLTGDLDVDLTWVNGKMQWQQTLNWTQGEVFWDPYYIKGGGHSLQSRGAMVGDKIELAQANVRLKDIGEFAFKGEMQADKAKGGYSIQALDSEWQDLDLATAYPVLFEPLLKHSMLNQAEIGGRASLKFSMQNQSLKTFHLKLKDANIDDKNRKFAFYNIQADIPWSYDDAQTVTIAYQSGQLLDVPLGATKAVMQVNRYSLTAPEVELPLLDGALRLKDISAARIGGFWHWHLGADILPIDMPLLSNALKWPTMQGTFFAQIPQVTYSGGTLSVNGDMLFKIFDGDIFVKNLVLQRPLSEAPVMKGDIEWHELDLGELTDTFKFGGIEGKIDGSIDNLRMDNWKMTQMDAKLYSSAGRHRKKISQRAVENISALGGAGAAAAIQRSFLRFFENFNYSKLGFSCLLKNDVCQMSGVESTDNGYIIVKGSGIPAINVRGFNRTVAWQELVSRVKRVADDNTKAIVEAE